MRPIIAIGNSLLNHRDVLSAIREYRNPIYVLKSDMKGCGHFVSGEVVDWKSHGFNLETPDEFRPVILEALGIK